MLIRQAVFGSARTGQFTGYQMLGRSPGLSEQDARQLTRLAPSHDSLCEGVGSGLVMLPLESGHFAIGRSSAAGAEFSGRGGEQVFTRMLVVTGEDFQRWQGHALELMRAVECEVPLDSSWNPAELLDIEWSAPPVLRTAAWTPEMAALIENVLRGVFGGKRVIAVVSQGETLVQGVLDLLPPLVREQFTFTVGLKPSAVRPSELVCVPVNPLEVRRAARGGEFIVIAEGEPIRHHPRQVDWPQFVTSFRRNQDDAGLAEALRFAADVDTANELDRLALELSEAGTEQEPWGQGHHRRDHAAHPSFGGSTASSAVRTSSGPARKINPLDPQVMEILEHLDDAVFSALGGDPAAIERVQKLWPLVKAEIDPSLVEESREQYFRHTIEAWRVQAERGDGRADRAVVALDVLLLLFT